MCRLLIEVQVKVGGEVKVALVPVLGNAKGHVHVSKQDPEAYSLQYLPYLTLA